MSKRLDGVIGCKGKTSSWHLNGFPDGMILGKISSWHLNGFPDGMILVVTLGHSIMSGRILVIILSDAGASEGDCEDEIAEPPPLALSPGSKLSMWKAAVAPHLSAAESTDEIPVTKEFIHCTRQTSLTPESRERFGAATDLSCGTIRENSEGETAEPPLAALTSQPSTAAVACCWKTTTIAVYYCIASAHRTTSSQLTLVHRKNPLARRGLGYIVFNM